MISIEPDQYVTVTSSTKKYLVATVVKRVDKMLFDVINKSIAGGQYLDFIDAGAGIYGRRYGINGGGIEFTILTNELAPFKEAINIAAGTAEKIPA
jgi:basic membrane protein A